MCGPAEHDAERGQHGQERADAGDELLRLGLGYRRQRYERQWHKHAEPRTLVVDGDNGGAEGHGAEDQQNQHPPAGVEGHGRPYGAPGVDRVSHERRQGTRPALSTNE